MTHLIDIYQLEFVDSKLRNVMKDIENWYGPQVITSIYRPGDPGVHGQLPVRGIDIRCRNKVDGEIIINKINSVWTYDPSRPNMNVAIAHGEGNNYHIHIQVHPNTISLS